MSDFLKSIDPHGQLPKEIVLHPDDYKAFCEHYKKPTEISETLDISHQGVTLHIPVRSATWVPKGQAVIVKHVTPPIEHWWKAGDAKLLDDFEKHFTGL